MPNWTGACEALAEPGRVCGGHAGLLLEVEMVASPAMIGRYFRITSSIFPERDSAALYLQVLG